MTERDEIIDEFRATAVAACQRERVRRLSGRLAGALFREIGYEPTLPFEACAALMRLAAVHLVEAVAPAERNALAHALIAVFVFEANEAIRQQDGPPDGAASVAA